jgi:hypothetical protein
VTATAAAGQIWIIENHWLEAMVALPERIR